MLSNIFKSKLSDTFNDKQVNYNHNKLNLSNKRVRPRKAFHSLIYWQYQALLDSPS